jgi:dTDP-4-amino-4,6-dideoxygalactose transaminase
MIPRHQLPAYSPLPLRALIAGAVAVGAPGRLAALARRLAGHFGARDVVLTDGGTSALALALEAAWQASGQRPVALPAFGCYDIATAAAGAGVPVLLYDIDPATLGPEPESLRRALRRGAGTVALAHLYGVPVDVRRVRQLIGGEEVLLVEDAAQGAGACVEGRPAGAVGDLGVLSFGRGKGVTGGGGGALLVHRESLLDAGRAARAQLAAGSSGAREMAATAVQWLLGRPWLYALPASLPVLGLGKTVLRAVAPPRAIPRSAGGMLAVTWPLAGEEARIRRRNAERLLGAMLPGGRLRPVRAPESTLPGYLRLPVVVHARGGAEVPEAPRLGVLRGYPRPLHDLPFLARQCLNARDPFPGATLLAERLLTLPTHSRLREPDLRRLERWIADIG